jgi:hypothetical protein
MTTFWMTTTFVVFCVVMAATSTARRVGDGSEYWAMAEQLGAFHRPSVAPGDLRRLEREAQRIDRGFEASPLRFDHLVAADERQDFPHFWLYPLANVPALWLTRAAGVHPNWAFTLTNCVLLAVAFATVSRHVSVVWSVLILMGPVIWWIDKAHGDLFTLSLLATGCALWYRAPGWTLVIVAVAAAQNPALMPVWLLIAGVAGVMSMRGASGGVGTLAGAGLGGAIIALPLVYYMTRLHVWSPLIGYTHPGLPSMRAVVSLLGDPNIGLLANVPVLAVAALAALTIGRPRSEPQATTLHPTAAVPVSRARASWREWAIVAGAWAILLAGYSQSVNLNHGATPGINRWTLWLTPWLLLIVPVYADAGVQVQRARHTIVLLLAALHVVWSLWFFRPGLPEVYRYPTRVASWLWTHAPAWYAPAPEIFAERVSNREPPVLPTAWAGCTIVLTIDGEWPSPCLPTAPAPATCRGPDVLCYAVPSRVPSANGSGDFSGNASGNQTTFVLLGKAPFPSALAPHRWPADAPFTEALRARVAAALERDRELRTDAATDATVRAMEGVSWAQVWKGRSILLIYVDNVRSGASLRLRADADHRGTLIDLDTNQSLTDIFLPRAGEHPTTFELPATVRHGLIWLESDHR